MRLLRGLPTYVYDFQGNRITKVSIPQDATQKQRHQVYVRDPQGNTLAIYQYDEDVATSTEYPPPVFPKEPLLYGSNHLKTTYRNVSAPTLLHKTTLPSR